MAMSLKLHFFNLTPPPPPPPNHSYREKLHVFSTYLVTPSSLYTLLQKPVMSVLNSPWKTIFTWYCRPTNRLLAAQIFRISASLSISYESTSRSFWVFNSVMATLLIWMSLAFSVTFGVIEFTKMKISTWPPNVYKSEPLSYLGASRKPYAKGCVSRGNRYDDGPSDSSWAVARRSVEPAIGRTATAAQTSTTIVITVFVHMTFVVDASDDSVKQTTADCQQLLLPFCAADTRKTRSQLRSLIWTRTRAVIPRKRSKFDVSTTLLDDFAESIVFFFLYPLIITEHTDTSCFRCINKL